MKKKVNRICYFFLVMTIFSIGIVIANGSTSVEKSTTESGDKAYFTALPDEDTTMVNSLLSALGGFSGGGLLLIFLIRRLVTSYDDSFSKWETRCTNHNQRNDEKNDKIICMVEDVHGVTQELKMEIIKLQANAVNKDIVTEALTKVSLLETDIDSVRDEVKSIMNHLLTNTNSNVKS